MSEIRVPLSTGVTLTGGTPESRLSLGAAITLTGGQPSNRTPLVGVVSITGGEPNVRVTLASPTILTGGEPSIRMSLVSITVLTSVPRERIVATAVFPTLIGLAFSIKKIPIFSTSIQEASSGKEVRTSYMEHPRWEFELNYDYLPDKDAGTTDLKTLMGFFLQRQGSFDPFLFKDPDDHAAINVTIATADGTNPAFTLSRELGGYLEPIGQYDPSIPLVVRFRNPEVHTIPATPGPYAVTVNYPALYLSNHSVYNVTDDLMMTKVVGVPGVNQYSVNELTGIYTFNSNQNGDSVRITYLRNVDPSEYVITLPNDLIFNVTPAADTVIYCDFLYYFVCRFSEDRLEFEKFMDKLWELQMCSFKSLIT